MIGYIYVITNNLNGKKYVGATINLSTRWSQHRSKAKKGSSSPIHQALQKHGVENFSFELLETITGEYSDLMAAEVKHIELAGSIAPFGYNLTKGGEGIDFSVPELKVRHAEGIRSRDRDPENKKAHLEGIRRRDNDPRIHEIREVARQKMISDPLWKEKCARNGRLRASNPKWIESNKEAMRKRAEDPKWREQMRVIALQGNAACSLAAEARDSLYTPEEQARRVRRRQRYKERMLRKQANIKG